jgi:hypothetical protein
MIQVDQAKLNEIIKAAVSHRFATCASVAKLFDLQRESASSDFPDEALILNFQLARSDYDRARQDSVTSGGVVLQFKPAHMRDWPRGDW